MMRDIAKLIMVLTAACLFSATDAMGQKFTARVGYEIGGTAPYGLPATIRRLDAFGLKPNFMIEGDYEFDFKSNWGLLTGLRIENKGMHIDAGVKGYHMSMVRGGEKMEGAYTGNVLTNTRMWMFTVPIEATFHVSKWRFRAGPYFSLLFNRDFSGYVYNGYLRQGDPTGPKIIFDDKKENRGLFDFSKDLRRFQAGIQVGADWMVWDHIGFFADVSFGLTGAFNKNFKTISQTMYPIYGTLGVMYGF